MLFFRAVLLPPYAVFFSPTSSCSIATISCFLSPISSCLSYAVTALKGCLVDIETVFFLVVNFDLVSLLMDVVNGNETALTSGRKRKPKSPIIWDDRTHLVFVELCLNEARHGNKPSYFDLVSLLMDVVNGNETALTSGRKRKPKSPIIWDDRTHLVFVELCLNEARLGNKPSCKAAYKSFKNKMREKTGKDWKYKQLKNHWDNMKKDWKLYDRLTRLESGIRWDPVRNTIDASPEWWDEKIKADENLEKFRGQNLEMYKLYYEPLFRDTGIVGDIMLHETDSKTAEQNLLSNIETVPKTAEQNLLSNIETVSKTAEQNLLSNISRMDKLKKALIKFTDSNPSLFPNNNNKKKNGDSRRLIQQQFSPFFHDNLHTPNHPPYAAMIHKAIWELNEKGGSNEESISKYIRREYVDLPWAHSSLLKHHLEKLCDQEEISLTRKQRYCLAGAESDLISEPESDVKRKRNSESGKKSDDRSKKSKKLKSEPDSQSGKKSSRHRKKKKKSLLDIHETNKKAINIFQVVEPLNVVADEQENITDKGMHEPQNLGIEDQTAEQENNLIDTHTNQEIEEGGVCANAAEQNQSKLCIITDSDVTGNGSQSLERSSDKELTGICGNNKGEMKRRVRGKKRKLMYTSIKNRCKRSKKREETQLQVGKANLKQHNEVTDNVSHELNQIIEANTDDVQFQEEDEVGTSVAKEVSQIETQLQVLSEANLKQNNEVSDYESREQNQIIEVNSSDLDVQVQEENEAGTRVAKEIFKNDNSARRVSTRSQLMSISKKDAIASSKLTVSPINTPNDKLDVLECLSEEKQPSVKIIEVKKEKETPSPASTHMNRQRAKLRSSQKNTDVDEPTTATTSELTVSPDYTNMPKDKVDVGEYLSEEKELSCEIIEVKEAKQTPSQASSQVNRQRAKLRSSQKNTELDEPTTAPISTEVYEHSDSQQCQQPEESEDPPEENKPKYKGRGSPLKFKDPETNEVSSKTRSAANLMKSKQSAKGKVGGKHPTTNLFEDEVSDKTKSTNKESQLEYIRHKMTRSGKMRDSSS
ncbi:myb/SANT-like domain-containing protein [Artemisia annua]|uniref:Myb/SANT-like domain-containing protein n=1 Tax=Artemisia annua TaxID=35608 RepID=A0A2U1MTD8_ARTAN|nr:myb/SANT-like domain-containing protein [Artemisia annua]